MSPRPSPEKSDKNFEDMLELLLTLRRESCAAMRRGEMAWYGMASDYQSKYAFSADYDPAFKRRYLEQATTCLEIAEHLEALPRPTATTEVAPFVAALKDAIAHCPRPPTMHDEIERLAARLEAAAPAINPVEKDAIEEDHDEDK
jgi:hypothetical protein